MSEDDCKSLTDFHKSLTKIWEPVVLEMNNENIRALGTDSLVKSVRKIWLDMMEQVDLGICQNEDDYAELRGIMAKTHGLAGYSGKSFGMLTGTHLTYDEALIKIGHAIRPDME